uniref:hypothetical protein n=1 Tax=Flavobacterium sp. TaxID=239 RepID=UPI0040491F84
MKAIIIILWSFISLNGSSDKQDLNGVRIQYEETSRGVFKLIRIENNHFYVQNKRSEKEKEILLNQAEWNVLVNLYAKIDLVKFEKLTGPTEKRFTNGASHANLIITKDKKQYHTLGFDAGNPPKEIQEIVSKIILFSEKK